MSQESGIDITSLERDTTFNKHPAYPTLPAVRYPYPGPAISRAHRQIRLLYLEGLPTTSSRDVPDGYAHLYGDLVLTDLDRSPPYIALSYVWGEHNHLDLQTIRIRRPGSADDDAGQIPITENGYQALWHIRKNARGPICIWIDAVCINQDDHIELGHQVRYMGDIYSTAQCVYVWLGRGDEGTDRAMQYLRAVGNSSERMPIAVEHGQDGPKWKAYKPVFDRKLCLSRIRNFPWTFGARFFQKSASRGEGKLLRFLLRNWVVEPDDLKRVLDNTWLSRSWTLPEFILARDSLLIYGDETIPWQEFLGCIWRGSLRRHDSQTAHWQALAQAWLSLPRDELGSDGSRSRYTMRERLRPSKTTLFLTDKKILWYFVVPLMIIGIWVGVHERFQDNIQGPDENDALWYLRVVLPPVALALITVVLVWFVLKIMYGANRGSELPLKSYGDDELFNMISTAMLNRRCTKVHDKCFSLYSVLERHGINMGIPDYDLDAQQVYVNFFARLVQENPQALALLVDAAQYSPAPDSTSSLGSSTTLNSADATTLRPSWALNLEAHDRPPWLPREFVLGAANTTKIPNAVISPRVFTDVGVLRVPAIPLGIITFRTDLTALYELHRDTAREVAKAALAELMLLLEHTQDMYKARPRLRRSKEANLRSSHFLFFRSVMMPDVWLKWNHQHHYSTAAPREHHQSSSRTEHYGGGGRRVNSTGSRSGGSSSRSRSTSSTSKGFRAKSERRLWESKSTFNQLALKYKRFFIPLLRIIRKHRKYRDKDMRKEEASRGTRDEEKSRGSPPESSMAVGPIMLVRSVDRLWKVIESKKKLLKALDEWCMSVASSQPRSFFATASGFPGTGGVDIRIGD
ncbi:heterokaryon incompatibility protein-domain-containing protein [Microdochium trichocladiopsis]|uniref:Heterokaryon incompatibility protein-domain-containing protein n=1 Tax=Microdochium trichocladiopsis TaxID=1682393 RepID=A0A9P8XSE7_9PEZI|nr:heterokaryon incompatibility protein-domain-containing protein [Microdochium trichocladiopsis]KAH7014365.1 heterokaryon incompatibility protein-domain-containing protein [Microdochium trichocladiopsis]